MALYLYFNSFLYFVFAVWCTALPERTSAAIGFEVLSASGKSEYSAIYSGLQLGLAFFYLYSALSPDRHHMGLMFSVFVYGGILVFRTLSFFRFEGIGPVTIGTAVLELCLGIWAAYLYFKA